MTPLFTRRDGSFAALVAAAAALSAIFATEALSGDPKQKAVPDGAVATDPPPAGDSVLARLDRELQAVARKVRPAAVEISVRVAPPDALVPPGISGAPRIRLFTDDSPVYFSGTLIDARGLVVTAADAVRFPATRISVRLSDSTILGARSLGVASSIDIGLLQLEGGESALAAYAPEFGDSNTIVPGSWVMSVGSPFGLSGTITTGIVSGVGRKLVGSAGDYRSLLQVTSPVNPGDAGSPLADANGRLIGVMALTYRRGGSTGAKGASAGAALLREFRVFCQARDGDLPKDPDEIEALWAEFLAASLDLPPESNVGAETAGEDAVTEGIHFAFPINDVRQAVSEILARSPSVARSAESLFPTPPTLFGMRIHAVGEALASQLGLEPGSEGVVIEEVFEGGWAARSGLRKFDVILSIGGRVLSGPDDVCAATSGLDSNDGVPVRILRQAQRMELQLVPKR